MYDCLAVIDHFDADMVSEWVFIQGSGFARWMQWNDRMARECRMLIRIIEKMDWGESKLDKKQGKEKLTDGRK